MEKKNKISIIVVLLTVLIVVLVAYFNPLFHLSQEFGELDSDLKHILTTIAMALIGGSLFAIRNKSKGIVFEQFEAIQLVLLIIIPSVVIFSFIMKNPENYSLAVSVYVVAVMIWFLIVILKHKSGNEPKLEKRFTITIGYILAVLLSYGIFAFWQIHEYHKLLAQMT